MAGLRYKIPDVPRDNAVFSPTRGLFSVVAPVASENLVRNPEIFTLTDYETIGAPAPTVELDGAIVNRGVYSAHVTRTDGGAGIQYRTPYSVTVDLVYSFSVDIYGTGEYAIRISGATSGNVYAADIVNVGEFWSRFDVTGIVTVEEALLLQVEHQQSSPNEATDFHADGFQLEQSDYATTFISGSLKGFIAGDGSYQWTGSPHNSSSIRSGQTRSGGRIMNLQDDLDFEIFEFSGLGYGSFDCAACREFTMTGSIAASSYGDLSRKRACLVRAFRPHATCVKQDTLLYYQAFDDCGDPIGPCIEIRARFQDTTGFEGDWDNPWVQRVALRFESCEVTSLCECGNDATQLQIIDWVREVNGLAGLTADGVWDSLNGGPGINANVTGMAIGADGKLYVVGDGVDSDDDGFDELMCWDGTSWSTLGELDNSSQGLSCIAADSRGNVYFGGNFHSIDGIAVNNIAYYDIEQGVILPLGDPGAALNGVKDSAAVSGSVETIAIAPDGRIVVGGNFEFSYDAVNGETYRGNIARFDLFTRAWSSMSSGLDNTVNSIVNDIAISPDGVIWAAGRFRQGVAVGNGITSITWFNEDDQTFELVDQPINSDGGGGVSTTACTIKAIAFDAGGRLYMGGDFDGFFDVTRTTVVWYNNIARYNGQSWERLDAVSDDECTGITYQGYIPGTSPTFSAASVEDIAIDTSGLVLIAGSFNTAACGVFAPGIVGYDGTSYVPLGIVGPPTGYAAFTDEPEYSVSAVLPGGQFGYFNSSFYGASPAGVSTGTASANAALRETLFVGVNTLDNAGHTLIAPAVTTVTNTTSVKARPIIEIRGPGCFLGIYNRTTGAEIRFGPRSTQLIEGEILQIDLSQKIPTAVSNMRGSIAGLLDRSTSISEFFLLPGENQIGLIIWCDTAAIEGDCYFSDSAATTWGESNVGDVYTITYSPLNAQFQAGITNAITATNGVAKIVVNSRTYNFWGDAISNNLNGSFDYDLSLVPPDAYPFSVTDNDIELLAQQIDESVVFGCAGSAATAHILWQPCYQSIDEAVEGVCDIV